jgi:EmrB/QacA subfamily drug resistance transporter
MDLDGTTSDAFWAGTSYLLTCAVSQPFIAALSDLFGRKEMLLTGIFFFTLGTLLCAPLAHNFKVLLAGRCLQGIGGGGIITMGQVIFADIIPLRQRPKYFSIVLAAWAVGTVLGPLIGGLFVEHLSWKWCFYINFPFCALGFVMVPLFVKLKTEKSTLASKLARVDWIGGILFIGGMTSFLIGLSWAGIQFEWDSAQVLAPLFVGVTAVAAAIFWENFGAENPFLRPALFSSPSAVAAYLCAFGQGFILFCALYYIPFYFTALHLHAPVQSGLDLLPVSCLLVPGSIVVSILTTRLGRFRWAIWTGFSITALGTGLLLLLDIGTRTPVWAAILCVFGIGNGILLTSVNVAIQAISKAQDCGRAAAMYAFMRTLGMSVGVAVGGTAFQNVMAYNLRALQLPDTIAANAEAFVSMMAKMDPKDPLRLGAEHSYLQGFRAVFWVMTAMALFGLATSCLIRKHSMDKAIESDFILNGARPSPTDVEKAAKHMSSVFSIDSLGSRTQTPAPTTIEQIPSPSELEQISEKKKSQVVVSEKELEEEDTDKVSSFLVGPGGQRIPLDPRSSSPLPIPDRMAKNSGPVPTKPEATFSEANRSRISNIMRSFH